MENSSNKKVFLSAVVTILAVMSVFAQPSEDPDLLATYNEAIADPWNEEHLSALLAQLPELDGYYFVEGDLLMTRREVQQSLVDAANAQSTDFQTASPGELIVVTVSGVPQFYRSTESRVLTYAIDKNSFDIAPDGAYETAKAALMKAMTDWQDACRECRIKFVYDPNDSPIEGDVWFIVRYVDEIFSPYVATAFYPHYQVGRRYLNIFPLYYFSSFDPVGALRHELGHVLGYRHEHTRNVKGCSFEDDEWKELTPYEPKSVMHYVCGDGGSYDLEIKDSDRDGHRRLYLVMTDGDANNGEPIG